MLFVVGPDPVAAKLRLSLPAGAAYMSLIRFELIVLPDVVCALTEDKVESDNKAIIEINSKALITNAVIIF